MQNQNLLLVQFFWGLGRSGNVEGLFVTTQEELDKAYGKQVYFGEILGKHSEVYGHLGPNAISIITEDQEFIQKLIDYIGTGTVSGYNPLDYIEDSDDEEEDD